MDAISVLYHLNALESSLSWIGFKESIVALSQHVWFLIEKSNNVENGRPQYMDTYDQDPEERDSRVIRGLRDLLNKRKPTCIEMDVILLHLAQAAAKLDGLGGGLVDILGWLKWESDGLPELNTEEPISEGLEYLLRSRRLNDQDYWVLRSSNFKMYAQKAAEDELKTWVCSQVEMFLDKRQAARDLRQLLESPCNSAQDYDSTLDHCCSILELNALGACEKTPKDLLSRIGLTEAILNESAAQTLAHWTFCEEIPDDSKKEKDIPSPTREGISSSITGDVLHRVIAYVHKHSALDLCGPTHIEDNILLNRGRQLHWEREKGYYWASRQGEPMRTWDNGFMERFRAMLERCRLKKARGNSVPCRPRL